MTHRDLVDVAARWLAGTRRCSIVLVEQGFGTETCDAIGWEKCCVVVECKVSRSDFLADHRKPHRAPGCGLGRERWYLAPPGLIGVNELPAGWGLLEWTGRIVRRRQQAPMLETQPEMSRQELAVALSELRKFHAQGIRYRKLHPSGGYADAGALGSLASTVQAQEMSE